MGASRGDTHMNLTERLQQQADQQHVTAYCAWCPDWTAEGTAEATRTAQQKHRASVHPETIRVKHRSGKRYAWRNLTKEQEAEIEEERRQRLRAMGMEP